MVTTSPVTVTAAVPGPPVAVQGPPTAEPCGQVWCPWCLVGARPVRPARREGRELLQAVHGPDPDVGVAEEDVQGWGFSRSIAVRVAQAARNLRARGAVDTGREGTLQAALGGDETGHRARAPLPAARSAKSPLLMAWVAGWPSVAPGGLAAACARWPW